MKSKTFFFNKTIFKKNLTRFWPLWTLYACYLIFALPLDLWLSMHSNIFSDSYTQAQKQILVICSVVQSALNPIMTFLFAGAAILSVFSYLYSARTANMIHALPVSRLELFVTNFLSAAAMMLIPQFFIFIATVFVGLAVHITNLEYIFIWFSAIVGVTFFALSFGSFVVMFTGLLAAFPFYYVIANYLYAGCMYLLSMVVESVCFGVTNMWSLKESYLLSPIYYLGKKLSVDSVYNDAYEVVGIKFSGGYLLLIYSAAAVVFLAAAYQLYKRRKLETAGDLISLRVIRPVFRWGAGICIGIFVSTQFTNTVRYNMPGEPSAFAVLFVSALLVEAVSFFGAEMLIEKTFHVMKKKLIAEWAFLAAISAVLLGMVKLDIFGIEGNVPQISEVKGVLASFDYEMRYFDETAIETVMDIHRAVLAQKDKLRSNESVNFYFSIEYELKNGERIRRTYPVEVSRETLEDENSLAFRILALEREPHEMLKQMFGKNYETNEYYAGSLSFTDSKGREEEYRFSQEELDAVMNAIVADVVEGNLEKYELYSLSLAETELSSAAYANTLVVNFYNPNGIIWNYDEQESADIFYSVSANQYIAFGEQCENIKNTLQELGILNEERKLLTYDEKELITQ